MYLLRLTSCLVVLLVLLSAPRSCAYASADPSGHWKGAIQLADKEVNIEVDLSRNGKGELAGTFNNPAKNIKGYPFSKVTVEGSSVRLVIKSGAGSEVFEGILSANGKSISGHLTTADGSHSIPFSLTRTGDAQIEAPPKSAPIGKALEGTWHSTLTVGEKQLRLVLKMSNQPDGSSTGSIVTLDEGNTEIPIAGISQIGSKLTFDVKVTGGSYSGALSEAGTDLVGTWTQGTLVAPLNFKRAGASKDTQ